MPDRNVRVAFVQDALPFWGGAEKVLAAALEVFPQAEIYTLVYREEAFRGSILDGRQVHTSFVDRLPGARRHHHNFLPLMPLAVERLDLTRFDVLVSFSYAVAHGIIPRPGQLHISYMHTPLRYAWQDEPALPGRKLSLQRLLLSLYLPFFRAWDVSASRRTHHFVAVSYWIAQRIGRAYHRPADVIYPPVDVERFKPLSPRSDFYLVVSRLTAHKRIDQVIEAFNRLGLPLIVAGAGPEEGRLRQMAAPNVRLLGWQTQEQIAGLLGRARAFVHAAAEDFGIAMVEAQAAGCPVIALGSGAAPEIIRLGETGFIIPEPSVEGIQSAIARFEEEYRRFDPGVIQENARRFDKARYQSQFASLVERDWDRFQHGIRDLEALTLGNSSLFAGRTRSDSTFEEKRGY